MTMPDVSGLPEDIDATYADDPTNPARKLHKLAHDLLHRAVKALLPRAEASATYAAKAALIAGPSARALGVQPIVDASIIDRGGIKPVACLRDVLYGYREADAVLMRSVDSGVTWTVAAVAPVPFGFHSLFELGNGQLVAVSSVGIARSAGWNPLSPTPAAVSWTTILTPTAGTQFATFSPDVVGATIVVAEYGAGANFADSRYVRVSVDSGNTFTTIFDKNQHVLDPSHTTNAHVHAASIDRFAPTAGLPDGRIFIAWHKTTGGTLPTPYSRTMYTDALAGAATAWTIVPGSEVDATITAIACARDGMICGTDDKPDGLRRILRTTDPTKMVMEIALQERRYNNNFAWVAQFARTGPDGTVYISYESNPSIDASFGAMVMASSDGRNGRRIYEAPAGFSKIGPPVVDGNGVLNAWIDSNTFNNPKLLRASLVGYGGLTYHQVDSGGVLGGSAPDNAATALGPLSRANRLSVAIGRESRAGTLDGTSWSQVAIGALAVAENSSVAVGTNTVSGVQSVVIGAEAKGPSSFAVVIGYRAESTNGGIVIGKDSKNAAASSNGCVIIGEALVLGAGTGNIVAVGNGQSIVTGAHSAVAVGQGASVQAVQGTAVGRLATVASAHNGSVALGQGSTTTAGAQVALGARHVELLDSTAPATPAATKGRLYLEGGALKFRGASGTVTVLAVA